MIFIIGWIKKIMNISTHLEVGLNPKPLSTVCY